MFVETYFSFLKNLIASSTSRADISESIGAFIFASHFNLISDDEEELLIQYCSNALKLICHEEV